MSAPAVVPVRRIPIPADAAAVPADLVELDQWVLWAYETRDGKPTKVPKTLTGRNARSDDPSTWTSFDAALEAARRSSHLGIGFVFARGGCVVGIDLDNCDGWAAEIVERFADTYIETTPSGRGLHIICRAELEAGCNRAFQSGKVEIYPHGRFFTVTGQAYRGAPLQVEEHQTDVEWLWSLIGAPKAGSGEKTATPRAAPDHTLTSEEMAKVDALRANDPQFNGLWLGGFFRNKDGRDDPSGGDLSVCNRLAYHLGFDGRRVDAAFRASDRMRLKWDERHHSDGRTYGQGTVDEAVRWATDERRKRESSNGNGYHPPAAGGQTIEDLNAMPIFRENGLHWLRFELGAEQIFGFTVDGLRVIFPTMADLVTFSRAQQAILRHTRIMLLSPPPKLIKKTWEPAVALMVKLATVAESSDQGTELSELLPMCFERAGYPCPHSAEDLFSTLRKIQTWERDPHDGIVGPRPGPFVFVFGGKCYVNAHKLRLWASLPRVAYAMLRKGDMIRELEALGFRYQRRYDVHYDGKRIQQDLWIGPVELLGSALDAVTDRDGATGVQGI